MATSSRARRFGTLLIAAGTLVVLAAASAWYFIPVQYEAFALLKVASKDPAVLGKGPVADVDFAIFKRTQVQLILSQVVLNGTLREPQINRLSIVQAHRGDPVSWLRNHLVIDYPDDAEIMRVTLRGRDPQEIVKIVDKVIEGYMRDILQHDKLTRMDNEEQLRRAYEKQSANYQRELDALRTLESIHKTSGSEAAQLQTKMAGEELNSLVEHRDRLRTTLSEIGQEIRASKARADLLKESRTADPPRAGAVDDPLSLPVLEEQETYLQEQLAKSDDQIKGGTDDVAALDSFSAQVAVKQEQLTQLRITKNQLGTELDRLTVERLAPERITLVDKAVIANGRGDAVRRTVGLSLAAALGIVLVALGLAIRLPQR